MRIYNLPRASGKTTRMLYTSDFLQIPILCTSNSHKECLRQLSKQYGLNIPDPLCVNELRKTKYRDILVDEALLVLQELLRNKGISVIGCTLSDEDNLNKIQSITDGEIGVIK